MYDISNKTCVYPFLYTINMYGEKLLNVKYPMWFHIIFRTNKTLAFYRNNYDSCRFEFCCRARFLSMFWALKVFFSHSASLNLKLSICSYWTYLWANKADDLFWWLTFRYKQSNQWKSNIDFLTMILEEFHEMQSMFKWILYLRLLLFFRD